MQYTNTIVRNGNIITLTEEEVENIYRYQQLQYRISDARIHVNKRILEYTDRNDNYWELDPSTVTDDDLLTGSSNEDIDEFHQLLSFTDDDLENLANKFDDNFDCNRDENSAWDDVISGYRKGKSMTIKQYFANGGKWKIECDTSAPYRVMSVNVGFINDQKIEDETQFDIQAYDVEELSCLFNEFCKENGFPTNTVTYVAVVQTAETMELLIEQN